MECDRNHPFAAIPLGEGRDDAIGVLLGDRALQTVPAEIEQIDSWHLEAFAGLAALLVKVERFRGKVE